MKKATVKKKDDKIAVKKEAGEEIAAEEVQEPEEKEPGYAEVEPSGDDSGREITVEEVLEKFDSFLIRRPFISLVGGLAVHGKTNGDIDILIKAGTELPESFTIPLEFRLIRLFDPADRDRVHIFYDRYFGPITDHYELADLKVERREKFEKVEMSQNLEEANVSKQRTSAGQKQTYNSPTFAYCAVYGKPPEEFLSGRTDHPQRTWEGVSVDEALKDLWLNSLKAIEGIEVRASCAGHGPERISYIVFRLLSGCEIDSKKISEKLNRIPGCYSLADIGEAGKMRIVVAGKVWYDEKGTDGWTEWWEKLAERIDKVVQEVISAAEDEKKVAGNAKKNLDTEKVEKEFEANPLGIFDEIEHALNEEIFPDEFVEKARFFLEVRKAEFLLSGQDGIDVFHEIEKSSNLDKIVMHRRFRFQKMSINALDGGLYETFSNQATLSYLSDLYAITRSSIGVDPTVEKQLFEKDEEFVLKSGSISPVFVSKKFGGVPIVLFSSPDRVSIFSDEGQWVENSLPDLVAEIKKTKQPCENYCIMGELEFREDGKLQPREMILKRFHDGESLPTQGVTFNASDVLVFDGKDVHSLVRKERRELLEKFNFEQCTMDIPNKDIILNLVPELLCETLKEADEAITKCSTAADGAGSIIALADAESSAYSLSGMTQAVFVQKQFALVHALIGEVIKTKTDGVFNYGLYLQFRDSDHVDQSTVKEIGGQNYTCIGKSYNSKIEMKIGDISAILFHSINGYVSKNEGNETVHRLSFHEPVAKKLLANETAPDFFSAAIKVGEESGLLIEKELTKAMDLLWQVPAERMKDFVPDYRRSDSHDQGVLKMATVPKELRKGRFVWFVTDDPGEDFGKIDRELEVEKIKKTKKGRKIGRTTLTSKRATDLEEGEGTYPRTSGRYRGVSVGKDSQGFFVFTHRARSKSYPSLDKIPEKVITWVASTG